MIENQIRIKRDDNSIPACWNVFEHILHLYGLSPVWTRLCLFNLAKNHENILMSSVELFEIRHNNFKRNSSKYILDDVNFFGQTSHSYGLSPVWVRSCNVNLPRNNITIILKLSTKNTV